MFGNTIRHDDSSISTSQRVRPPCDRCSRPTWARHRLQGPPAERISPTLPVRHRHHIISHHITPQQPSLLPALPCLYNSVFLISYCYYYYYCYKSAATGFTFLGNDSQKSKGGDFSFVTDAMKASTKKWWRRQLWQWRHWLIDDQPFICLWWW